MAAGSRPTERTGASRRSSRDASFRCLAERAIHAGQGDDEPPRDLGWAAPLSFEGAHYRAVDRRRPPIDARALCARCPQLALATKVGLELREQAEDGQERLAGGRGGIDRMLRCLEPSTLGLEGPHDVLQIADGPGEAVDAGDNEGVALADEVGDGRQLGPAGG